MGTGEIILFAVQSALNLAQAARQAYVDSTASAALALPLPDFNANQNFISAVDYFTHIPRAKWPPGVATLMDKNSSGQALTGSEQALLLESYNEQRLIEYSELKVEVNSDGTFFTADSIRSMVTIRQWARDPNPSPLQRVAGTLVRIGVDFYAHTPGALNGNSAQGQALKAFLVSLDRVDFAADTLGDLIPRMFVSTIESLAQYPQLLSRNRNTDALISGTAAALATNVKNRIKNSQNTNGPNLSLEQNIVAWGDVVYRSVVQGAGGIVAKDPVTFLGLRNPGDAALVGDVTDSMIAFLMDGHSGDSISQFGTGALNTVLKSALDAISNNPALVLRTRNKGLQNLLQQTAKTLASYGDLLSPTIVPDITSLILTNSAADLELVWPHGSTDPADHLLLTAADCVLKILSNHSAGDRWHRNFTAADVTSVVNAVFAELLENPGWLVTHTGRLSPALRDALGGVLAAIRAHADNRLSPAAVLSILETALIAAGTHSMFLNVVPQGEQPLLAAAVQAVVEPVFDPALPISGVWTLVKKDVVETMVDIVLTKLSATDFAAKRLTQLITAVGDQVDIVARGGGWNSTVFATAVANALAD